MRHQNGHIWKEHGVWFGKWREDVLLDGKVVRKRIARKLCEYSTKYRTKGDVQPLLDAILKPLNEGRSDARCTMLISGFVERHYIPYVRENLKPSTSHGYERLWGDIALLIGGMELRDFRTVNAAELLRDLHGRGWGRRTLQHAKSLLSGIFTYAKSLGVLDGVNPVKDALIPKKAQAPEETHATTADEVMAMLQALDLKPRAAVALIFFAGLRPGEARGVRWEDYDGRRLVIRQSVWRTHVTAPKTESSAKPVPVIEPLRSILADLRTADGNPSSGSILRGPSGKPLNLNNLARREVMPALCKASLKWHGWYSLRRGIGTLATSVAHDPMAAKGLLRHSNLSTTLGHYVKDVPEITMGAMRRIEQLCGEGASLLGVKQDRQMVSKWSAKESERNKQVQ